ncbi:cytochrome P450 [Fennellomyces sp. T-0311]|nr:cytochrome P450 [Fennellomyces sp. T-0311]
MINHLITSIKYANLSSQQISKVGVITVATIITSFTVYRFWISKTKDDCPMVPYTNPVLGSTMEYCKNPQTFVENWTEKLGPVYRVHLFGRLHTVVSGPYVHEVYNNRNFSFLAGVMKRFNVRLLAGINIDKAAELNIIAATGRYMTQKLKNFAPRVAKNLTLSLNEVLKDLAFQESVEVPDMYPLVQLMIARGSASVIVGEKLCQNMDLIDIFQNITKDLISLHPRISLIWLAPFPRLRQLQTWAIGKFSRVSNGYRRKLREILVPEIDMRLKNMQNPDWQQPEDVLQKLIDLGVSPGQEFYETIISEVIAIIFASMSTTTQEATAILYHLLQDSGYLNEILQEQRELIEQHTANLSAENEEVFTTELLRKMIKLESFCRESLRFGNQFYDNGHTNIGDTSIILSNGTMIEPDGDVLINIYYNHRSESWSGTSTGYGRAEFKPFRFVGTGKRSTSVGDDDYLPFGQGRHACPGRWFAMQQIKAAISILIRDYEIRSSGDIVFPKTIGSYVPFGSVILTKRCN